VYNLSRPPLAKCSNCLHLQHRRRRLRHTEHACRRPRGLSDNQTLVIALNKMVSEHPNHRDKFLDAVAFEYRMNIQYSRPGCRPAYDVRRSVRAHLPQQLSDTEPRALPGDQRTLADWKPSVHGYKVFEKRQRITWVTHMRHKKNEKAVRYNRRRETRKDSKLALRYEGTVLGRRALSRYQLSTVNGSPVKVMANAGDLNVE